jgi:DNA-binding MarR family transcriptional regulator
MDYNELALQLADIMQNIHNFQKKMNDSLHGETVILHSIACKNCDVLPGQISDEINVSSARVASALGSLESKGYITRRIDENDRRKILVSATESGKVFAKKQHQEFINGLSSLLTSLGEEDAKEYIRLMNKIAEIMPEILKTKKEENHAQAKKHS